MKNLDIKLKASSHQPEMKLTVSGIKSGLVINHDLITTNLNKRRPNSSFNTSRVETDEYYFTSGVKDNITTGEELTIVVKNNNVNSSHYPYGVLDQDTVIMLVIKPFITMIIVVVVVFR